MSHGSTVHHQPEENVPHVAARAKRTLRWHLGSRAFLLLLVPGLGIYLAFIGDYLAVKAGSTGAPRKRRHRAGRTGSPCFLRVEM